MNDNADTMIAYLKAPTDLRGIREITMKKELANAADNSWEDRYSL
jgi:hypothetical protein